MNKKISGMVAFFVIVVILMIGFVFVSQNTFAKSNYYDISNVRDINAHSCKADEVCEMTNAQIGKNLTTAGFTSDSGTVNDNFFVGDSLYIENDFQVDDRSTLRGEVRLTGLNGQGNAYACLNSNGVLYRSNSSCA